MSRDISYFAEDNGEWESIPAWVNFLIRFGFLWGRSEHQGRRIALVSMPCPSPGAGLIALGAMISDLGKEQAADMATHNDLIFEYSRQYLEHCKKCRLKECDPIIQRCGFKSKSHGLIRSVRKNHIYVVSEETDFNSRKLVLFSKRKPSVTIYPNPEHVVNLYIDGQPPAFSYNEENGLEKSAYQGLIEEAQINPDNLRKSSSGLVLAGRAKGGLDTRLSYEEFHFGNDIKSYNLADLLSIHGWTSSKVSRIAFFNVRTESLDHAVAQPKVVIADGDSSFLKTVDTFKKSDVIGVIDRSTERDRLEVIGQKFADLKNWYQTDTEFRESLPIPVPGITVAILKKQ